MYRKKFISIYSDLRKNINFPVSNFHFHSRKHESEQIEKDRKRLSDCEVDPSF